MSTAYFALFDAICSLYAQTVCGPRGSSPNDVWTLVYRSIDHGAARKALLRPDKQPVLSTNMKNVAEAFAKFQQLRSKADYDPQHQFSRDEAVRLVDDAEYAIDQLHNASSDELRAVAARLLVEIKTR